MPPTTNQLVLLDQFVKVWKKYPQFSFTQLVSSVNDLGGKDIFETTDQEFVELLTFMEKTEC